MATTADLFWKMLTNSSSNTDAITYAMASVAPVSGQVVLACVASLKASAPDTPTLSGTNGFSGSWTQIGTTLTVQTPAGNYIGVSWFWSVATSSVAGIVTANYTNTQLASCWTLQSSPFINTTTPVPQSKTGTDTSADRALPAATLDAALSSQRNWVLYALAQQSATAIAQGANVGYLAYNYTGAFGATDGVTMKVFAAPSITFTPVANTYVASVGKAIFAIEVAHDGTGEGGGGGLLRHPGMAGGLVG